MTFFGPDIRNGLPIGLGSVAGFGRRAFTPSVLFAAGEQGFWYDPTDIPVNWRRNLLTYTEQFDNAAWTKASATVVANQAVAPDGTTTADLIYPTTTGGDRSAYQTLTLTAGTPITFRVWARNAGFNFIAIAQFSGVGYAAWVNLTTGAVSNVAANYTATAVAEAGGYWVTVTGPASATSYIQPTVATSAGSVSVTANGTDGIFIWGAQLERGSVATDYQRIVTPEISFLEYQPQPVMYTDSAGTTPVTAVEQAVGLVLDKSKGLVIGPELVTNGNFSNGTTGWTITGAWAESGGQFVKTGGSTATASQAILTIGKTYRITVDVVAVSTGVLIYAGSGNAQTVTTPGTKTFTVVCLGDTSLYVQCLTAATATIDNISVRELAGNHAIQPGATNRPILRSRYNLLTYSEDFSNAAWTKTAVSVSANAGVAPDGTTTADKLIDTAASTYHFTSQTSVTPTASTAFVGSIYLKAAERTFACVQIVMGGINALVGINLSTGALTTPTAGSVAVSSVGNGWYVVSLTVTTSSTTAGGLYAYTATSLTNDPTYLGDGTSGIFIWGADLRRSIDAISGIPSYQRIAAATDYDTVGFPVYLAFDGSDDSLYTGGNIDFSATDKMTVWAGVTKLSDGSAGTYGCIAELGTDINSVNGTWAVFGPAAAPGGTPDFGMSSRGTLTANAIASSNAAPITRVITGEGQIGGLPFVTLRLDGTQAASGVNSQGTGNYGSYPLYIGRRNNATLPFNGRLFQLIGRGAATSAALITQAERWVAGKQGRAL